MIGIQEMTYLCLALLLLVILPPFVVLLAACIRSGQVSRGGETVGGRRQ